MMRPCPGRVTRRALRPARPRWALRLTLCETPRASPDPAAARRRDRRTVSDQSHAAAVTGASAVPKFPDPGAPARRGLRGMMGLGLGRSWRTVR
eukprot:103555-Hanusia_phi.AAC.2